MTHKAFEDEIAAATAEIAELKHRVAVLQVASALMGHPVTAGADQGGMFGLAKPVPDPAYIDVERIRELMALPQSAVCANVLRLAASVH